MNIFALFILTIVTHFEVTTEQLPTSTKNKVTLEKVTCRSYPGSKVSHIECKVKKIDRYNMKIEASANISEPIHDVWFHVEPYYKFNRYTRIAGHIRENGCDWLKGKKSILLDYFAPKILKYTNVNHTCPYSGYVYLKVDNISVQDLAFPQIMPSGRYMVELFFTEGDRNKVLGSAKVYSSVSDHRIEVV